MDASSTQDNGFRHPDAVQPIESQRQRRLLQEVKQAVESVWLDGSAPTISKYLPPGDHPLRRPTLVELIKIDQKFRWRDPPGETVEDYLARWPELLSDANSVVEIVISELVWRGTYGHLPNASELRSRFPTVHRDIDLKALETELPSRRTSESLFHTGRYFVIRELGRGGMGRVYKVWDRTRGGRVALKMLPTNDPELLYQFKREFRSLTEIVHRNLASLYELTTVDDQWFFTMELIVGVDFGAYVRLKDSSCLTQKYVDRTLRDGDVPDGDPDTLFRAEEQCPADLGRLRHALRQLVEGLIALHRFGKVHRDIKPSNVLVRPNGELVILDFGLIAEFRAVVNAAGSGEGSSVGSSVLQPETDWTIAGTAAFMSPEQADGQPLTEPSDWYSVGIMLYESLTGRRPFQGAPREIMHAKKDIDPPPPSFQCKNVPKDLNDLCVQLLNRSPAKRPTGEQILARLGADAMPADEEVLHDTGPFVGRNAELSVLRDAFARTCEGATAIVNLRGASGAGKTRLSYHFLTDLSSNKDVVILTGRCYERETVPYKALDSLIDSLNRYLRRLTIQEADALMPRDIAALARVFPVLQNCEAVRQAPQHSVEIADMHVLRRRAVSALRELLSRLGDRKQLVLCIDDLQWGDADSAAMLSEVLRPPDPPQLLLLALARSEHANDNPCLAVVHELTGNDGAGCIGFNLEIGPLATEESQQLAGLLMPAELHFQPNVLEDIARDSQGMPFFVQELARHARSRISAVQRSPADRRFGLEELLHSRIDELPAECRRLLEAVTVAGQPIPARCVYHAAELETHDQRVLATLRAERLVRTAGPNLDDKIEVFHDRIGVSVVKRLQRDRLLFYHRMLAESLERCQGVDPEMLAVHHHGAEHFEKASHYYSIAADQAGQTLAFDRAARMYRMSIDLDSANNAVDQRRHKLSDALANAGRGFESAQEYALAADRSNGKQRLELERRAAHQYLISGHFDIGRKYLKRVLTAVGLKIPKTPRRALISLVANHGWLWLRGLEFRRRDIGRIPADQIARVDTCWSAAIGMSIIDIVRAADFHLRGLRLAFRTGDPSRVARSLAMTAIHLAPGGSKAVGTTRRYLAAAESVAHEIADAYVEGLVKLAQTAVAFMQGRFREAFESASMAEEVLRDRCNGVAWELDAIHTYQTWALVAMGEVARLRLLAPDLVQDAVTRGDLFAETNLTAYAIPHIQLWDDMPDLASRTALHAQENWSRDGFFAQHLTAMVTEAEIALYRGDGAGALSLLEDRWQSFKDSMLINIQYAHVVMLFARARGSIMSAAASGSRSLLAAAAADARRIEKHSVSYAQALAELIHAGLAQQLGDESAALERLKHAEFQLQQSDLRLHAAAARRRLGQLIAGARGQELVRSCDEWMANQGIRNPARTANAIVPGFPEG